MHQYEDVIFLLRFLTFSLHSPYSFTSILHILDCCSFVVSKEVPPCHFLYYFLHNPVTHSECFPFAYILEIRYPVKNLFGFTLYCKFSIYNIFFPSGSNSSLLTLSGLSSSSMLPAQLPAAALTAQHTKHWSCTKPIRHQGTGKSPVPFLTGR